MLDFINDVRNRGAITNSWYLTSIQAGFEPWQGGDRPGRDQLLGGRQRRRPTPATTPPPTSPPPGNAACKVTYKTNTWNTGFTADVTVANTGRSPINGWTLNCRSPATSTVT